jgi:hypothetical protein
MSYTAIVLDEDSAALVKKEGGRYRETPYGADFKCHHVTLAMGADATFPVGKRRILTVTHIGCVEGRVSAFRVLGADDSKNKVPHVTIAVAKGAKPVESNQIVEWREVLNFSISGKVEICH